MNITIGKPCAISEKGGRLNNEDSLYPQPETVTSNQRLFLVCDGVGGSDKGEVASTLACESIQSYFSTFLEEDPTKEFIQKAIQYTEARFDDYVTRHPEAKGMATTLTLLYIGQKGVTIAHIGDSRIYHFRDEKILYQTEDHSLVNSLVRLGKISREEAATHPQRNVILRAIQGSARPSEADVVLLPDIQEDDKFFMCTDGVLENLSNEKLSEIFENHKMSDAIKDEIVACCTGCTRDNFSFYIIPIQHVHDNAGLKQNLLSLFYSFI
ncbi:protein phosphatase 2C domain-containing protein [Parabacteroides sp. OttesenSCG-928-K15]|nr:protein phosphatase 2C domain-containing protein [Parabacteroides sp. OttesenSCG-928-K15]